MALSSSKAHKAARVARQRLAWIGFVFCLACATAAAQTYEVLYNFGPQPSPAYSYSALVQDSSGNFYGTSTQGSYAGTIFKLEPDGTLTILHSFQGTTDGGTPYAGLIWDDSGNLYGTTSGGGDSNGNGGGTVFKLDPSDVLTTLYAFVPWEQGLNSRGSLVRDGVGNLYGTTAYGGLPEWGGYGIVFKVDPSGTMTTLHMFDWRDNDGVFPRAGLIRDTAGNLYGTTSGLDSESHGIRYDDGSIFRVDAAGTLTTLHSFNGTDGAAPFGSLILDDSGNLYGTTRDGGSDNLGTIFRLDNAGVLTTLYEFTGADGAYPTAALIRDDAGNLYGTTANGGDTDGGTVFRLDSLGHFTRLHSFNVGPLEGVHPRASLIQNAPDKLVGTTLSGGPSDMGVIFRVNLYAGGELPIITGFSPASGPSGTDVTISGSGLTGATAVAFHGIPSESFSTSPFEIIARVPPGATTGKIAVTAPGGTAFSTADFTVPGPTITSFSPTSGLAGTIVTINGTDFTGVSSVKFNGLIASSFNVLSPTQLTAVVRDGTTSGKITVTTPLGTGTSATDFLMEPTVTAFSPGSGLPGTSVVINGTNLATATAVAFNGHAATFTIYYNTAMRATVPEGATTGKISVTTPAGTAFSATDFKVLSVPTITSFTPTAGSINTLVTINGTGFTGVSSVKFNGKAAGFNVLSSTQLTARVSSGTTTGTITVTTSGGTATSAANFIVIFKPTVTGFTPGSGVPGTPVVITGTNFDTATAVAFDTASTTAFTINSPTQITVNVPSAAKTGKIKVTNPAGAGWSMGTFLVRPTITSFSPASGRAGSIVIIVGTTFNNALSVTFNGLAATFTITSPTKITAIVPSGATSGKIAVTTPGGTATSATAFKVLPTITSFSPTSGRAGTHVIINGNTFLNTKSVTFNGVAANFTINSSVQITAGVPAGATSGRIAVTTPSGTATSATNFTVLP